MPDKIIGHVYETTDYDQFSFRADNRPVEPYRKRRIKESILRYGYKGCPIIVNAQREVIDGQGRLAVCRDLQCPIAYIVIPSADAEAMRALNAVNKKWDTKNFVASFCTEGRGEYKDLSDLQAIYRIPSCVALFLASGKFSAGGQLGQEIKSGEFKFVYDIQQCREEADYLTRFLDIPKGEISSADLLLSIAICIRLAPDLDRERLYKRLHSAADAMRHASDKLGYIEQIETIYNRRRNGAPFLSFVSLFNDAYPKYAQQVKRRKVEPISKRIDEALG